MRPRRWLFVQMILLFVLAQRPMFGAPDVRVEAGLSQSGGELQIRNELSAYYASRCVVPYPTSIEYWVTQWHNWGHTDPEYFWRRVAVADEFTVQPPPPPCPVVLPPPPPPSPLPGDLSLIRLQIVALSEQLAEQAARADADHARLEAELQAHRQASQQALEQGKSFLRGLTKYLPYILTALGVVNVVK